ncbi:hypothetical protein B0H63DRAFT_473240 [Podospora didyma]|uniref:Uncharacterized protein n=1 Tax=Podospora didyma TaxID=330526 RepID=A0AAE0TZU0_9PEZI|nr:hypothetical protein B0H63DRAFT_473240 [Podospora didyma]
MGPGVQPNTVASGNSPGITQAPALFGTSLELQRRDARGECGYFFGSISSALACPDPNLTCSTANNHVNCCPSNAPCAFPTACLDYRTSQEGKCSGIGDATFCCGSASPYCNIVNFADLPTLSIVGCVADSVTVPLYASVTGPRTATTSTSGTSSAAAASSSSAFSSEKLSVLLLEAQYFLLLSPVSAHGAVSGEGVRRERRRRTRTSMPRRLPRHRRQEVRIHNTALSSNRPSTKAAPLRLILGTASSGRHLPRWILGTA